MTDDRLDRLEQRLRVLEGLVRQLIAAGGVETGKAGRTARIETPPEPVAPPPRLVTQDRIAADPAVVASANEIPTAPPKPPIRPSAHLPARQIDSEQWFGQRGLLAVGVIFLILAAGYLLKLSFERGWISPAARCAGGAVAGIVVGAIGWKLQTKVRTYGAALIGCGAAIIYVSVWAATRWYNFLPPTTGIAALALVSLSLAAIAYAIDVEALGATAALGAFFAPIILPSRAGNADALLLYLACIGLTLGWVAARRRWRATMLLVGLSFFGLTFTGAAEVAQPYWVMAYGLIGGCAGLYVGLREGWFETRVLGFSGGWGLLAMADDRIASHEATVIGAAILAAPVWWRALKFSSIWPRPRNAEPGIVSLGETLYFYITPLLLAWAVYQLAPVSFDRNPGLVPLIVAVPYLLVGFTAPRRAFALVGSTAILAGVLRQWSGVDQIWALLVLTYLWAALDHLLKRTDGRWYALLTAGAAIAELSGRVLPVRSSEEAAFIGTQALIIWTLTLTFVAFGRGLWRRVEGDDELASRQLPSAFWVIAGVFLLFGVTGELRRYFLQRGLPPQSAQLAGGLAVSAWWIIFAAVLVLLGFRRGWKPVRVAGLLVAGMAVTKVVLFDLSTLDALYRVGSVLILGVVSLGLAYLYNKQEGSSEEKSV